MTTEVTERVRAICNALPESTERLSHGAPTFFVQGKRTYVTVVLNHHSDGRIAIWCAAPPGAQQALAAEAPDWFFVPPYVGWRGWLGIRLDRDLSWEEVAGFIKDAYCAVAPAKLIAEIC